MSLCRIALMRIALTLAIGASAVIPTSAVAQSGGADLGSASAMQILNDCNGGYMQTTALINQCSAAQTGHWIILGWEFNPSDCSKSPCAKPDGFHVLRTPSGGSASVIATQAANYGQPSPYGTILNTGATARFGTILQNVTGDQNIGACFSIVPYRGTTDIGRPSNAICIEEVAHIAATRWGTAHNALGNDGSLCSSPKSNPAGYQLMFMTSGADSGTGIFAGYVSRTDAGCNFYQDIYQALLYYDLTKYVGKTVTKATLKLHVVNAAFNPGGKLYDTSPFDRGGMNGNETRPNLSCITSAGLPKNVNVATDSSSAYPKSVTFDTLGPVRSGTGEIDIDLTATVKMWLKPGAVNHGIVLSPSYLDPLALQTSAAGATKEYTVQNLECLSQYSVPVLDIDIQ